MSSLLLVLPYHSGDVELARNLLTWMGELKPHYSGHSCLLVADNGVHIDVKRELQAKAKNLFLNAETMLVPVPYERQGWPKACNFMFEAAARQISETMRLPWLWCEPDCVPLKKGWLDDIADAYAECPRRFMGAFAESIPANGVNRHLIGCSVYDPQAYHGLKPFMGMAADIAWDVACSSYTAPRSCTTPLIQHFWGTPELPPRFTESRKDDDPKNVLPFSFIKPEAVLFHRCKDDSLISVLRHRQSSAHSVRGPGRPRKNPIPAESMT